MRIKETGFFKDIVKGSTKKSESRTDASLSFADALQSKSTEKDAYTLEVDQLRKEIDMAGDTLIKEPNLANFKKYKQLLGQIAKKISNEAYQLEKVGGTPMNPRYFEVIKVINEEADQLYKLIIGQQQDNMKVIEKVIGIKGMVVDLIT